CWGSDRYASGYDEKSSAGDLRRGSGAHNCHRRGTHGRGSSGTGTSPGRRRLDGERRYPNPLVGQRYAHLPRRNTGENPGRGYCDDTSRISEPEWGRPKWAGGQTSRRIGELPQLRCPRPKLFLLAECAGPFLLPSRWTLGPSPRANKNP